MSMRISWREWRELQERRYYANLPKTQDGCPLKTDGSPRIGDRFGWDFDPGILAWENKQIEAARERIKDVPKVYVKKGMTG